MKVILAYPGNMPHAQNVALAMLEVDALSAFVTTFAWREDSRFSTWLGQFKGGLSRRIKSQLSRRAIADIPPDLIHTYPLWELLRTASSRALASPVVSDWAWDRMSISFDRHVARRYVPNTGAILSFEYTALESFEEATKRGVGRVLFLPSLDSLEFERIQRSEKERWPELIGSFDPYFDKRFAKRYARRREEIELADVIITNSSLTSRSHVKAGADPTKTYSVPLGSPPAISMTELLPRGTHEPLNVMWAGNFSLGKGAHYLLDAWRRLGAGPHARLDVFGRQLLPEHLLAEDVIGIVFHGSVPQSEVLDAYKIADVFVFPTLSDGFGMVVAEALAHGVPVITTDQAGAADLIDNSNGFIIPSADPVALASALQWCLDNRDRLSMMRIGAVRAAQRRQWSDFRRDLVKAVALGLGKAGHAADWRLP